MNLIPHLLIKSANKRLALYSTGFMYTKDYASISEVFDSKSLQSETLEVKVQNEVPSTWCFRSIFGIGLGRSNNWKRIGS